VSHLRSSLMWGVSLAVVATVAAARPAVATAQEVGSTIEQTAPDPATAAVDAPGYGAPMTRGLGALARPEARIAFGVRRGAIQHIVTKSPFDDVYGAPGDPSDVITLVTVHRFGQRASGGVRFLSNSGPPTMPGPSEEPLRLRSHPPIVWNLAERIRIAFGGSARSLPMIDQGLERVTPPAGSLTIEFGDRR